MSGDLSDAELEALAAEYASPVSMEWVPDLVARCGLTVDIQASQRPKAARRV